jgi:hypothetical protein
MPLDTPLRTGVIALLISAACMGARLAQAAAPGYEIQVGLAESDNIQRLPSGGNSDTIGIEELDFTWHDKRPWLKSDIDADLSHLNYFRHTYGQEVVGSFLGQERITLAPQLLSWDIGDVFGQDRVNPLAPITPANRENINYFSTGPTLTLPLGGQTQLNVSGQYGRVDFEHSPLDSTRLTGVVGLQHDVSPNSNISINATKERTDFKKDQLNPDYDRQEAFARFDGKGSRTELGVDLGYGRLDMPGSHDSIPVARLELSRHVSANSIIGVALGHDYSDGADSFRFVQALEGAGLNTQSTPEAGAPFVDSYATLEWNFRLARTTLDVVAAYFREHYQTGSPLNNDLAVVNARAVRRITPVLQLAATEYLVHQRFNNTGDAATETDTGLQLTWHAGSNVSVFVAYFLSKSSSDIRVNEFTENRLWLSIGYGRAAEVPPGPAPLRLPRNP